MATTPNKLLLLRSSFEDFISAMRLDSSSIDDVDVYHLMLVLSPLVAHTTLLHMFSTNTYRQHEARQGRSRLIQNRAALLSRFRNNPAIRPPFQRTHLDYKAFLEEARKIHESASPETRARYDLVKGTPSSGDSNAAVKWLLWQALRQGE